MVAVVVASGCSHGGGTSGSSQAAATWPGKWCQAQPGITKDQLVGIMGTPTRASPASMTWSDDHYQFNAFLEDDGTTIRQLDTNEYSYTAAEKASEPCKSIRSKRGMEEQAQMQAQAASPMNRPACELVSQEKMSAILGSPVVASASGRDKCVYTAQSGKPTPYVEFSYDIGDGAAGMAGAGFAGSSQKGLTNNLEGIGDQAVAAGPALFIRTGDVRSWRRPRLAGDRSLVEGQELRRLGLALFAGGLIAALAMAVLLGVFANIDAHQPVTTDLDLHHVAGMSVFFSFFTVPVAVVLGVPSYWLLRRLDLLRVWVCSALGAAAGVLVPYTFHLTADVMGLVWFSLSGAAAGAVMGMLLRRVVYSKAIRKQ
jgi:hypothetical protein